jgi:SAM-dependent MidA family methyltransferase
MKLKKHIQQMVRADGPIPFERFMEIALYHPDGFFGGETLRSDRDGDFLTSPEVSGAFGETLAGYVRLEHQRIADPFTLVEVGAGSGSLLVSLLSKYPVDALAVEMSPAARRSLSDVLPAERVLEDLSDLDPFRGVIVANELIDNLPMAIAQKVGEAWRERFVGIEGDDLVFVDTEARSDVLEWLGDFAGDVPDGGWVEVQFGAGEWLRQALSLLRAGSILLIDYGDTAEGLMPRRQDGTLRTYRSHHLGPHPLDEPGATDITADVNFTALEQVARDAGTSTRLLRQDDFLTELGLRERLSEVRHAELEATRSGDELERLKLRALKTEIETVLHPRGLGDFRVLVVEMPEPISSH